MNNLKDFEIIVASANDTQSVKQCLNILDAQVYSCKNKQNLLISNYIVCAKRNNEILGFIGVDDDKDFSGDLYISQVAVKSSEKGKGIEDNLLKFVKHHSKGFMRVTCDIKRDNHNFINLYIKNGFQKIGNCDSLKSYRFAIKVDKIENNEYIQYTEDEKQFE